MVPFPRFYAISEEARLHYASHVAEYLLFLAEHTGLAPAARCKEARQSLKCYPTYASFIAAIGP